MYLKNIEIQGFKSFANRINLKFEKGITAIVGPNGSGKSNIADAVRWVLGEQSAKQLRSSKMEDVIFSGTESRKPQSFAFVSITLDNQDRKLPVSYDEVTVARKVYRSGESQYMLNGSICRLKDIQELFMDTGIGKEGYSIIGQGQIDQVLSGKPEDRRELFDEAAGIVKYKKRKQTALKDLAQEEQNLARVNDILAELEKQAGPLKEQADTAKEYLRMRDRLKLLEAGLYVREFEQMRADLKTLEGKLLITQGDLADTQSSLEQTKQEYEHLEEERNLLDQKIAQTQEELNGQKLSVQTLSGERDVLLARVKSDEEGLKEAQKQEKRLEEIRAEKEKEAASYEEMKDELDEEITLLQIQKTKAEEDLKALQKKSASWKEQQDAKSSEEIELLNQAAGVRAKGERYDTLREQAQLRKAQLSKQLISLTSELEKKGASVAEGESKLLKILASIEEANKQKEALEKNQEELAVQIKELQEKVGKKQQEFHEVNSRYSALKNISEHYEGYGQSVKKVMACKKEEPGIIGAVADILKVDQKYETAIEIALGGSIQNIVTEDEGTAKRMIAYLKENRLGRATFLPLTTVQGREQTLDQRILSEPGVLGFAESLVSRDAKFDGIVSYLLGRIVVTDTVDHALALAKKYHYALRIVTLEGELLSPGGALAGGAYQHSNNLLGRSRQLSKLAQQTQTVRKEIDQINQSLALKQEKRKEQKKQQDENARLLQELSLSENTARMTLNQEKLDQKQSKQQLEQIERENKELDQQLEEIKKQAGELQVQLSSLENQKEELEKEIADLNERTEKQAQEEQKYSESILALRVEMTRLTQKSNFAQENSDRAREELNQNQEEIDVAQKGMKQRQESSIRSQKEAEEKSAQMDKLQEEIQKAEQKILDLTQKKETIATGHQEFFEKRESLSDRIRDLDQEIFRLNQQKEKIEEKKAEKSSYLWEEYECTYSDACAMNLSSIRELSTEKLKKAVGEQKAAIKDLGNVNVAAIEEYQEVHERCKLMRTQRDDLTQTQEKLQGVIASLNQAMREQFTKQFAKISENFNRVFQELFGGGKASLSLVEGEDVLDAGIYIYASPPGKKLQNMMMLSGGEKALTAIALLFAIQSLKPSPFCILDEIEAALDDANVKRFAQYLNHLTDDTQFVIITHRRGTMNAADVLYGITMQEKGVSTLVSVSLVDQDLK